MARVSCTNAVSYLRSSQTPRRGSEKKFGKNGAVRVHEDGARSLELFGNAIAYYDSHGRLWVSDGGYGCSVSTKRWLNHLPGVYVNSKQPDDFLNGREWDGYWTCVDYWGELGESAQVSNRYEADNWTPLAAAVGE